MGLGLWDSVEVEGWGEGGCCLVCVGLGSMGVLEPKWEKSSWLGRGQGDPGSGGAFSLVHLGVRGECLYS